MSQLYFSSDVFLKANDLKEGHCYLYKDGRLAVYLGRTSLSDYLFYSVGTCLFEKYGDGYGKQTIAYYENQISSLNSLANAVMNSKINPLHLSSLKGLPKLLTEYPFINFEQSYSLWYTKNCTLVGNLPKLSTKSSAPSSGFVKAQDLIPGELYYTGSCWRACYVYLGRDNAKNFCWYFIGNFDSLFKYGIDYSRIDRTGSNKRCRPLAFALQDPHAYVDGDVKRAVAMNFKVTVDRSRLL